MLLAHHLTKTYAVNGQPLSAVGEASLHVGRGEFVAVRGSSGCGKSTLLLMCGGLLVPTQGTVTVAERDIYALSPSQRRQHLAQHVGFVFQQFHLVPYLTVLENILTPRLALQSRATTDDRLGAETLAHRFALEEKLSQRPDQLSVGERQRVALARALMNRPAMILADEPTGNLDPQNSRLVLQYLRDFCTEGGAVLMVTHHSTQDIAVDRTLHMRRGRILEQSSAGRQVDESISH